MPLTRNDIDALVENATANLDQIKSFSTHVQEILKVIGNDELPAGTRAEDVGRPPAPETVEP